MEKAITDVIEILGVESTKTTTALIVFILVVVPGFLIVFVRSQFVKGTLLPYPAGFFSYLTISVIYWLLLLSLTIPIMEVINSLSYKIKSLGFVIVLPVLVGALAGQFANKQALYRVLRKLKFNPIHPVPSAWDYTFSDFSEQFVLVRLKDGTSFGGLMGTNSFFSSDTGERDMFIEEIYEINEENVWVPTGAGVFVSGGEMSTVEFLPLNNREGKDE